jgi:flagellar hook-associated protein 2
VGITFNQDGTIAFDSSVLQSAYDNDPSAVETLFTASTDGISTKLSKLLDRVAGSSDSLLVTRVAALGDQIDTNKEQITRLNDLLASEETRLYTQFYNLELTLSKLQSSLSFLDSIQAINMDGTSGGGSSSSSSSHSLFGGSLSSNSSSSS